MQTVFTIAYNDLRLFFQERGSLISLLLVPLVMTFLVGYFVGGGGNVAQTKLDVINLDNSAISAQFLDSLRSANSNLILCPLDNDEEDRCELGETTTFDAAWALARVEDSTTQGMIEIPADFGATVQNFEPVQVIYRSRSTSFPVQQALDAAIGRINGAVMAAQAGTNAVQNLAGVEIDETFSQALYERAAATWADNPVTVTLHWSDQNAKAGDGSNLQEGMGQSVPGMGSMFVMMTVLGGMTLLIQERKQWTLQRLAAMPISRGQLLAGKILGRFVLGLIQYLVVFGMGVLLGINFGNDLLALVLIAITFTLAVTALSFALGSRLQSEEQAGSLSLLLALVLAPLGGAWWPLEVVPDFMRIIGHISPVAWAMDGYNQLIFFGGHLSDVLLPIGVLAAMAVVFFAFAIMRFRYD